jgi:hypothetical protein
MPFTKVKPVFSFVLLVPLFLLAACGGGGGESGGGTTMAPAPAASTPDNADAGGPAGGSADAATAAASPLLSPPPVISDHGGSGTSGTPMDPAPPDPVPVNPGPVDPGPVVLPPVPPGVGGGVGGLGHGPAPLNLGAAVNFAVVAETAITTASPSVINGNVGLSPASGANVTLGCPPVTGRIYTVDSAGPLPCQIVDPGLLSLVVGDGHTAWHVARDARPADFSEVGSGNIGGMTLAPATYRWSTGVQIPANLTLSGGPNDVWIFVIETDLVVGPGVQIVLAGGAVPQNIFWVTLVDNVEIGARASFQGVILAETTIDMKTGATINGRLLAAQGINLDGNTVTQP